MTSNKFSKIRQSIRYCMTKIDNITFINKLILKRQLIVTFLRVPIPQEFLVLSIMHFHSFSDPSYIPFFISRFRENTRFHPILKQRVFLSEVHDIKFKSHIFRDIFNSKKKPLIISFCVDIILKE